MKASFTAIIQKFGQQGEKTGWSYIVVPAKIATSLSPGSKKAFRVKGKLDNCSINHVALLPRGNGDFILALNAQMRKAIKKVMGASINVSFEPDNRALPVSKAFLQCLEDEPAANDFFKTLVPSHQFYYTKWIESAKSEPTKTKRIALAINTLSKKMGYPQMLRFQKEENLLLNPRR